MIDASFIRSSEIAVSDLSRVRYGLLIAFVPQGYKAMDGCCLRRIQRVIMCLGTLADCRFVESEAATLHWSLVVRRINLLNDQFDSFAIVPYENIDTDTDVAAFLRHHLKDFFPVDNDKYVVYRGRPFLSKFRTRFLSMEAPDEDDDDFSDDEEYDVLPSEAAESCCDNVDGCGVGAVFAPDPTAKLPSMSAQQLSDQDERYAESCLEREKEQWLARLSNMVLDYTRHFNELPPLEAINQVIKGHLLIRSQQLSPVHVNGDMRIFLPGFNEMELHMTPLSRAVYILFLCHPEGIRMKEIGDYAYELTEIYSMVRPRIKEQAIRDSIADLVDLSGESMQQKLSMTRRAVRRQILDPGLSERYLIKGSRGMPFRIDIAPDYIVLPSILRHDR